jgi:metallo-beta-lactamase family protein
MKIKFCGAAQEVTGSAHLVTLDNGFTILLDCGLYQGDREGWETFNETWLFDPKLVDCVVLSHAHTDHTGRLPKLVRDGFQGMIYATHATRDLSALMLMDSAKIQENDADYSRKQAQRNGHSEAHIKAPLYDTNDAQQTVRQFVSIGYDQWLSINDDVKIYFSDSGHILGSASVVLYITENGVEKRLGFTGDIGRPGRPILRDPQPMLPVDTLISESTYGDKDHESAPNEFERFARAIYHTCVDKKGKVIIPAFSIGRTQELLYMLDQLYNKQLLPEVPVYIDSPLSVNAIEIFRQHPECYDGELQEYILHDENPFGFRSVQYIRSSEESKQLNQSNTPCIIISASGMANSGRVKHHIFNNIENSKNTILIVGYCAPNTPGGVLRSNAKKIELFGKVKNINAEVVVMDSFSAHGDRKEMLDMIQNQAPTLKQLFLVHGDPETQTQFKDYLHQSAFAKTDIVIPALGDEVTI